MKKLNYLIATSLIVMGFALNSCEKNPGEELSDNVTSAADYTAVLELLELDDIDEVVEDDALKSVSNTAIARCFEVTVHQNDNSEFWPRSWTFVYGNSDCADHFGNVKMGSVNVVLTDFWKNEGSVRTITMEDFSINGNQLEGTRTIENTGLNEMENLTFSRNFKNASYTKGDSATMTWECNRDVEMISGYETFIAADDEYLVSGGAEGINFDGIGFTMNISGPLHYKKCSRFPVSGDITIELENGSTVYINYGDGACDNIAEMTIDDVVTEVTLGLAQ